VQLGDPARQLLVQLQLGAAVIAVDLEAVAQRVEDEAGAPVNGRWCRSAKQEATNLAPLFQ
jgi:hypothetical protein